MGLGWTMRKKIMAKIKIGLHRYGEVQAEVIRVERGWVVISSQHAPAEVVRADGRGLR